MLNRDAMSLRPEELLAALQQRAARKKELLQERDRQLGANRIRITSYMENIGWPPLFGYDMNDCLASPEMSLEMALRQALFWLDNVDDDGNTEKLSIDAGMMYYDITLFGERIDYSWEGIPRFRHHPIAEQADLSLLPPFDFRVTGAMPLVLRRYEGLRQLSQECYGGQIEVTFPQFERGPIDILMQLRRYENVVMDMASAPEFVHGFIGHIVAERRRWRQERAAYLGAEVPQTTYLADDWTCVPFVSPALFREYVLPAYRRIGENEGQVIGFHTCGNLVPLLPDLFRAFPAMRDVACNAHCNDLEQLDAAMPTGLPLYLMFLNTFILTASEEEHRRQLQAIARIGRRRPVNTIAAGMVSVREDYTEDLGRLNRFIHLARTVFAE
jgi:hypothetical protein